MNAIAHSTASVTHSFTRRSLDQLEQDIVSLSQHINASEYELLVMLCSAHQRLLHEGGFEIRRGPGGAWQFRNASGLRQPVT